MKKCILFDHDGVLVDTEFWYYHAAERALADIGVTLDMEQYLLDTSQGLGTWFRARAAGVDEQTIARSRDLRDAYYQEFLRTEAIEIEGVVETLAELSQYVRMAVVTTAKRTDFELIHETRQIRQFMDFVLVREDYEFAKPWDCTPPLLPASSARLSTTTSPKRRTFRWPVIGSQGWQS